MADLNKQEFKTEFAGQPLSLTISRLAEQASAAVLGQYGDTSVLVTVTMGKEDRDIDYLPLVVDYEEKFYAAGKIIGSRFIRREGRPSEEAVLSGRLIDRTLRPLFTPPLRRDVQIIITVLSYDEENDPDFIALLAASTALSISAVPWAGPLAGIRLARTADGQHLINPTNSQLKARTGLILESFIAGKNQKINMIELSGNEAKEDEVVEACAFANGPIEELIRFQEAIVKTVGQPKIKSETKLNDDSLQNKIADFLKGKLEEAVYLTPKKESHDKLAELKRRLKDYLIEEGALNLSQVDSCFEKEVGKLVRKNILDLGKRPDGRKLDGVRPLYAEVGLFKRLHGSALFSRGNTQALAVVTLAPPGAEQLIETMELSAKRRFMLHYNFPPYSVGEVSRLGSPGRREIGHGALAEKALHPLLPSKDDFPYTIRVVSEILSSNGSSSMASVSASSLALMDAGVPIKKAASGIAMGLITDTQNYADETHLPAEASAQAGTNAENKISQRKPASGQRESAPTRYKILTDIQGPEDHHGDMDLKVAGSRDGITAIQMDVKIEGIPPQLLKEILLQAQKARVEILEFMKGVIEKPRASVSLFAPVIMTTDIRPEQIGEVIGPGGRMINSIIQATGVLSIDIEQTGKVFVAATDQEKAGAAIRDIKSRTRDFQVGEIVEGPVVKILDFGAIVDLGGGKDGMIHISELKDGFVQKVEDVVKSGDQVKAKVIRVEDGRIGLSLRALPPETKRNL